MVESLSPDHRDRPSPAIHLAFRATDAAGEDGAIRHVMFGVNPHADRC